MDPATIGDVRFNGWILIKLSIDSEAKTPPKEGHGDCLVVYSRFHPSQLPGSWRSDFSEELLSANRRNEPEPPKTYVPALVIRKETILSHDNPRPHVAQPAMQKVNKLGYETLPNPPY